MALVLAGMLLEEQDRAVSTPQVCPGSLPRWAEGVEDPGKVLKEERENRVPSSSLNVLSSGGG